MNDRIRKQWERLGANDPYWAVLTNPENRDGNWNPADFFRTGEKQVVRLLSKFNKLGLELKFGSVLDFGCGVGRVSRALSERFDQVTAVDVSGSMLDEARKANQHIGNITFVHNPADDLSVIPEGSIDLVYTNMVLQHMPRTQQIVFIKEFCRILRPKGFFSMQTHAKNNLKSWQGWVQLLTGNAGFELINRFQHGRPSGMEMHTIPARTVMKALDHGNMNLIDVERLRRHSASVPIQYIAQKN